MPHAVQALHLSSAECTVRYTKNNKQEPPAHRIGGTPGLSADEADPTCASCTMQLTAQRARHARSRSQRACRVDACHNQDAPQQQRRDGGCQHTCQQRERHVLPASNCAAQQRRSARPCLCIRRLHPVPGLPACCCRAATAPAAQFAGRRRCCRNRRRRRAGRLLHWQLYRPHGQLTGGVMRYVSKCLCWLRRARGRGHNLCRWCLPRGADTRHVVLVLCFAGDLHDTSAATSAPQSGPCCIALWQTLLNLPQQVTSCKPHAAMLTCCSAAIIVSCSSWLTFCLSALPKLGGPSRDLRARSLRSSLV